MLLKNCKYNVLKDLIPKKTNDFKTPQRELGYC